MSAGASSIRERLAAGPARGLGCADDVAREAAGEHAVLAELVAGLDDERPVVVARAANALKKVQALQPRALDPWAHTLVRSALACEVLEARWNLTIVLGGLRLRGRDRALAIELLFEGLTSDSVFLRTFAMQALADLSEKDRGLEARVRPVIEEALRHGTAAMRARARKLLRRMGRPKGR